MIDQRSGDLVHRLRIEGVVRGLYEIVILSGVARPMSLSFKTDEVCRTVSIGPAESL